MYLDTVITVVDTSTVVDFLKDPQLTPLLEDQIRSADMVVLNKYDRAGYWRRRAAQRLVRKINPEAHVGSSEFGRLPAEEVIATGRRLNETAAEVTTGTNPDFRPLVARFLREERPFHPERLDAWLNDDWPGIIRVKGFAWLATDMENVYVVDVAGPQREVGMEGTWYAALDAAERPDDEEIESAVAKGSYGDRRQAITVIGVPDAVERELRNLKACLLSGPELDRGPRGWRTLDDPITRRFAAEVQEDQSR